MASEKKSVVYIGSSNNGVATVLAEWKHSFLVAKTELADVVGWEEAHSLMPEPRTGTATFVNRERARDLRFGGYFTGDFDDMERWLANCEVASERVHNFVPFSNQRYDEEADWRLAPEMIKIMFGLEELPYRPEPMVVSEV